MNWKNHLYWICLAAVLIFGAALWCLTAPTTEQARADLKAQANLLSNYVRKAGDAHHDALLNTKHIEMAKEYAQKLDAQKAELLRLCRQRSLDTAMYAGVPTPLLQFDNWLGHQRQLMMDTARSANLQLPSSFDQMTFSDSPTSETSIDARLHRDYRIRYMAIVDQIVNVLARKYGRQEIRQYQPSEKLAEEVLRVDIGAVALENFTVASQTETQERAKRSWEAAAKNAGAQFKPVPNPKKEADLPYSVTDVEVCFVANQGIVPVILQALETNPHYSAVVTRVDLERVAPPYPLPSERMIAHAGPNPMLNTYFNEGPVRVLVALDLYEYDSSKEEALKSAAAKEKEPAKEKGTAKKGKN